MNEGLVCLLLLLHCTAVTVSQSCLQNGAIEVFGVETDTVIAGRLEICVGGVRRAVYHDVWGIFEAQKVCQELGFPPEGAIACGSSCLGASSSLFGFIVNANCQQARLIDCGSSSRDGLFPNRNAGLTCTRPPPSPAPSPTPISTTASLPISNSSTAMPTTAATPTNSTRDFNTSTRASTTSLNELVELEDSREGCGKAVNCTAIGTTLGILSVTLFVALVGVVTAWVWSCYRATPKKSRTASDFNKSQIKINDEQMKIDGPLKNPHYQPNSPISSQDPPKASHTPSQLRKGASKEMLIPQCYEIPIGSKHTQQN